MRKFRPYHYGGMADDQNGDYVIFSEAQSAIEQARRDERAKCVAELEAMAQCEHDEGYHGIAKSVFQAARHLAKGLNQ